MTDTSMTDTSTTDTSTTDMAYPADLADARAARSTRSGGRSRGRGRRAVTIAAAGLLVVLAVAGVAWVLLFSSLVAVDRVTVLGTSTLPADEIRAAAGVNLGTPLARIDVDTVAQRLNSLPRVGSVEVRRSLPRELVLIVIERVAVAATRVGGRWSTLDSRGEEIASLRERGTLVEVAADRAEIRAIAIAVWATLPAKVSAETVVVSASTRDDVTLTLRDGRRVVWGDVSRAERKGVVLRTLLTRPGSVYDVSAPDLPTIRP